MPVMPRNFCFHMTPSLCKSVECESLSLIVGQPVGWCCPHSVSLQSMVCLEHYRMPIVVLSFGPSGLPSQRVGLALACDLLSCFPRPEVMIGNMLREPEAAHNQTLPNSTFSSLLGLQDHWCFWWFGPAAYQLLPIFTMVLIWAQA